jgi:hypothetical protein
MDICATKDCRNWSRKGGIGLCWHCEDAKATSTGPYSRLGAKGISEEPPNMDDLYSRLGMTPPENTAPVVSGPEGSAS